MRWLRTAHGVAILGWLATVACLWLWFTPLVAALATLPVLPTLPGLIRRRRYTMALTSLLSLAYIALGLTEAFANPAVRGLATWTAVSGAALFVGCVCYVKLASKRAST